MDYATEKVRVELELVGELFKERKVGYRSPYTLKIFEKKCLEILSKALGAKESISEYRLDVYDSEKVSLELLDKFLGKKVRVKGILTATYLDPNKAPEGSQLRSQVMFPFTLIEFHIDEILPL